jgi:hypothetical protein
LHLAALLPRSARRYPEDILERGPETQRPVGVISTIEFQQITPASSTYPDSRFRFHTSQS